MRALACAVGPVDAIRIDSSPESAYSGFDCVKIGSITTSLSRGEGMALIGENGGLKSLKSLICDVFSWECRDGSISDVRV